MKNNNLKMNLPSLDSLFTTQEERDNPKIIQVTELPINLIKDFPNHPFKVIDDEYMEDMVKSVNTRGVIMPTIVRKEDDGGYCMISGHRRKHAAQLAGLEKIPCIVMRLTDEKLQYYTRYNYLKYFIKRIKSNIGKATVISNLDYLFAYNNSTIKEINEDEVELFTLPFLSNYNLIPRDNIKRVYELLVQNEELKKLILFLYMNKLTIQLDISDYEKFNVDTIEIKKYLSNIVKLIDNETMYRILCRWKENNCSIYDLKIIESKIGNVENYKLEDIVNSRSGYINFIFGNRICNLELDYLSVREENLLIYAISNNKKGFINLIEKYCEDFLKIPDDSILFDEYFYKKYININDLNVKNLKELKSMHHKNNHMCELNERNYTFNEIKALYGTHNIDYYKLYNYLSDLRVDERIIRIKQLINKDLISQFLSDYEIESLSNKIVEKSLYNWMEQDFKQIKNLTPNDTINILINYSSINKFINDIRDVNEVSFLLRNIDTINKYNNLQSIKDNIENIDKYWKELIEIMNISQEFIEKHKKILKNF